MDLNSLPSTTFRDHLAHPEDADWQTLVDKNLYSKFIISPSNSVKATKLLDLPITYMMLFKWADVSLYPKFYENVNIINNYHEFGQMGSLQLLSALSGHKGIVWNVSWHPLGKIFASCGEDKIIKLWSKEGQDWAVKTVLMDGHQRTIREIAWSPCGNFLASASFDATTAVWDKKSGQFECNATLEGHENEVKSVAWSASGNLLATCGRDKSVWVWEVAGDDEYVCEAVLNAHNQDVKKVVWHPTLDVLASASYDNTVKLYKEDPLDNDWSCIATLESHESTVWSLAFDKSGERLATVSDDKSLKIWKEYKPGNPEGVMVPEGDSTWKCICTLSGFHTRPIYDIAWCQKTDLIATACGDDIIRIFKEVDGCDPNAPTFELVCTKQNAHSQDVNCVKWNPTGNQELLSCSDDGEIRVWKLTE